ncbi:MAG: hypothetical protein U1E21_00800 [Reyranellaceae bacterium]
MASPSTPAPTPDDRAERLAAALRENLKRRKARARAQADARPPADPVDAAPASVEPARPLR